MDVEQHHVGLQGQHLGDGGRHRLGLPHHFETGVGAGQLAPDTGAEQPVVVDEHHPKGSS